MLVLDTNVYLDALADGAFAGRLADAIEAGGDVVGLSSVVLAELLVGTPPWDRERLTRAVTDGIAPGDYVTPTHADWTVAATALQQLGGEAATRGRSFWNDLLIGASCARANVTLLTRNTDDFRRIQRVIPVAMRARPV